MSGKGTDPSRRRTLPIGVIAALMLAMASYALPAYAVDLPTYGYTNARLGASPGAVGIKAHQAAHLHTAWHAHLSGAIDGEPLIVNGVRVGKHKREIALVGTEHGEVVALELGNGHVLWRRHVATRGISASCMASPDGTMGVTATMVADPVKARVYAVDGHGRAWAFHLRNGRNVKGWPVQVFQQGANFDWGALALAGGWLYIPVASTCDVGHYSGGMHAVNLAHPKTQNAWLTTGGTSAYAGGIWGWGGEAIDKRTGNVFVGTGNALPLSNETAGNGERLVKLSPTLKLLARNYALTPPFSQTDRDFGSAPTLVKVKGCPLQVILFNKDGWLYRYNANKIAKGPVQSIHVANIPSKGIPLYGMAAFDPGTRRLVLTSPDPGPNGRRMGIQSYRMLHSCRLVASWQHGFDAPSAGGPPIIAEGVLYIGSGRNGILRVYRLGDGHELFNHNLGSTIFGAPAVADGVVLAGDWKGDVWAFRP